MKGSVLYGLVQDLSLELKQRGVVFTNSGWPKLPPEAYLREEEALRITQMLPYTKKSCALNKATTAICFYETDTQLCKHVRNLNRLIREVQSFRAVCGMDFSVCLDVPSAEQNFFQLANRLLDAWMWSSGIRLIPNFRCGRAAMTSLLTLPQGLTYSVGALGCAKGWRMDKALHLRQKLLILQPARLLIYGRPPQAYLDILEEEGIPYTLFTDFRAQSYRRSAQQEVA